MENGRAHASTHEEACLRVASRFSQRWLRHYAGRKLRLDPVFRMAYDLLGQSTAPLLDVGCGVGLLGFYLWERGARPKVIGLDRDKWKLQQGRQAGDGRYDHVHFQEQNVSAELPAFCGNVALLDVLHYLEPPRQTTLLGQLAARVAPRGMLLLRDCPRDGSFRYWATYLGETVAQTINWNIAVPLHFPARDSIVGSFSGSEFTIEEKPAWGGGPFNNRLYVFRRNAEVTVEAAGT
jgi:2-polyprenyl-3-methyl-5-hydroxy-6-metoxy-1,4-benzoquinol methylase